MTLQEGTVWHWKAGPAASPDALLNLTVLPSRTTMDASGAMATTVPVNVEAWLAHAERHRLALVAFVHPQTGVETLQASPCLLAPPGCADQPAALGWGDATTGALFGTTRLSGRPIHDGTLAVQDEGMGQSRTITVERDGPLLKLTPTGDGRSLNFGCNVLDDPVWVDARTGIPQRCGDGESWRLDSTEPGRGAAVAIGADLPAPKRLLPLLPLAGILPPQADAPLPSGFTLQDAYDAAMGNAQWSAYARQGRNVVLSEATVGDSTTTCLATLCTTSTTWTLVATADGQQGLVAKVTRSAPFAGPAPPDSVEVSPGEAPRSVAPLAPAIAGIEDARRAVAALTGSAPTAVQLFDDNQGHRPRYTYTFTLGRRCLDAACQGSTFDTLTIDARSGSLMAATLAEPQARAFVPA
ncbi:MAG: hypothetical protein LC623_03900 [Halobacteriales archaeon]|nr:hypothetical protein [Halobacteriales archaeon]